MPSLAQFLIHTAAIGGITHFWVDFTFKTWRMVRRLTYEILLEEEEMRRKIEIEDKIKKKFVKEVEKTDTPINFVLNFRSLLISSASCPTTSLSRPSLTPQLSRD